MSLRQKPLLFSSAILQVFISRRLYPLIHFLILVSTAAVCVSLANAQSSTIKIDPRARAAETAYARGDYEMALNNWTALANSGDADAKYFIGMLHEFGKGTPTDLKLAYRWYLDAAQSENPRAQFKIGEIYELGNDGNSDIQRAVKWWERSANNGYASAKLKLSWAYYNGIGVAQDRDLAARLIAGARTSESSSEDASNGEQFTSQVQQAPVEEIKTASIAEPEEMQAATVETAPKNETTTDANVFVVDIPTDVLSSNLGSANKLMTLAPGTRVKIITRAGKRALVRVPGGVPLWMASKYVSQNGAITGEGVRVRPLPSTASNAAPLGNLQRGERVRVLSQQNGWTKIIAPERIGAWINVAVEETSAKVVASTAPLTVAKRTAAAKPPAASILTQGFGKILREETTVFALPTPNATTLITLRKGTPLKLLEKKGSWYRVAVPGGLPIWVYGKYVDVQSNNRGVLTGSGVRARALPSTGTNATVVGAVDSDELVQIIGQKDSWYYVRGPERISGWIRSDRIQTADENDSVEWQAFGQMVANDAFTKFEREF